MSAQLLFALPISAPTTPSVAVAGGEAEGDVGGFGALMAAQAGTPETGAGKEQAPAHPARPDHRGSGSSTPIPAGPSSRPEARPVIDEQVAAQATGEAVASAIAASIEDAAPPATDEANVDPAPSPLQGLEDDTQIDGGALPDPVFTPAAQVPAAPRLTSGAADGVGAVARPGAGVSSLVETSAAATEGGVSASAPIVGDGDAADMAEAPSGAQAASTSVRTPIKEEGETRAAPSLANPAAASSASALAASPHTADGDALTATPPLLPHAVTTADQGPSRTTSAPAGAWRSPTPQPASPVASPVAASPTPEASIALPLNAEAALDGLAAQAVDPRPSAALSRHAPPPTPPLSLTSTLVETPTQPTPPATADMAGTSVPGPASASVQSFSGRQEASEANPLIGDLDAATTETDAPQAAPTPASASQAGAPTATKPAAVTVAPLTSQTPAEPQPTLEPPAAPTSPDQAMGEASPAPVSRTAIETTAQVAAQILRRLDGRSTRFEMVLTPESLGRVDVSLDIDSDGRLAARLAFDNPAAALDMKGRADDLRRQLEAAGFQLAEDALDFSQRDQAFGQGFDRRHDGARAFARGRQVEQDAEAVPVAPAAWVSHSLTPRGVDLKV